MFAFFLATTSNFPHGTRTLVGWLDSALYCLVALKADHVNLLALFNMLFTVSSCTLSLQARQSPWTLVSNCVTKIFRQNSCTIWRHSGQGTGRDVPLSWSKHLPQTYDRMAWPFERPEEAFCCQKKLPQLVGCHKVFTHQIKRIFANTRCLFLIIFLELFLSID